MSLFFLTEVEGKQEIAPKKMFSDWNAWSRGLSISENKIFVADGIHNEIFVYDLNGKFLNKILLKPSTCDGHTHGITVLESKMIFTAKENDDCITIYDLDGYVLNEILTPNFSPENIEVFNNKIFVTDNQKYKILILTFDGKLLEEIELNDLDKWGIACISDCGFDNLEIYDGKIFMTSPTSSIILISDLNGNFLDKIKIETESKEKSHPVGIDIKNNQIFISDSVNHKIQIFTIEGVLLADITSDFKGPTQIIMHNNEIFVLDTYNQQVKVFDLINIKQNFGFSIDETNDYQIYLIVILPILLVFVLLLVWKKKTNQ